MRVLGPFGWRYGVWEVVEPHIFLGWGEEAILSPQNLLVLLPFSLYSALSAPVNT